jgi:hypothetical protein
MYVGALRDGNAIRSGEIWSCGKAGLGIDRWILRDRPFGLLASSRFLPCSFCVPLLAFRGAAAFDSERCPSMLPFRRGAMFNMIRGRTADGGPMSDS